MSTQPDHHALTPGRERATLLALGAVQFTHIMDFMIMMPLGAQLMRGFGVTPVQFTQLVACYGLAAALSGFAGGFILDRFNRKRALIVLYAGFGVVVAWRAPPATRMRRVVPGGASAGVRTTWPVEVWTTA